MKRKFAKYLALFMSAVMLSGVCPLSVSAASYNRLISCGEDTVTSGAVPYYLTVVPENGINMDDSIVITVENGRFDFDAFDMDAYTYISGTGNSYDECMDEYYKGIPLRQVLNSNLGNISYELPYKYNLTYTTDNKAEVKLFPIGEEDCYELNNASYVKPRYNIPLPVISDGGEVKIKVNDNGSGVSCKVESRAAEEIKAEDIKVNDILMPGDCIISGSAVINGSAYSGAKLPYTINSDFVSGYRVLSSKDGVVSLTSTYTESLSGMTVSHKADTVAGNPIGSDFANDFEVDTSVTAGAYMPVCLKYAPENGVERGTVVTVRLNDKAEFNKDVFPMPSYSDYDGRTFDDAIAMLDSGASSSEVIKSFLGNVSNRLPYKVIKVTAKEMSIELMPIAKEDCGSNNSVCYEKPVYNIPIHAMAKAAGTASITVTSNKGGINKGFDIADIIAEGNEYSEYSLEVGDTLSYGDVVCKLDNSDFLAILAPNGKSYATLYNKDYRFVLPKDIGIFSNAVYTVVEDTEYIGRGVVLSVSEGEAQEVVQGDTDNSGTLTAADCSQIIQKVLNNDYQMPAEYVNDDYLAYADMDGNGTLTAGDAAELLQNILNGK